MSTIHSHLPPLQPVQMQQALSQSLLNVSAQAQPAVQDPDGDGTGDAAFRQTPAATDSAGALWEIAQQNQLSELRDPAEAAAANGAAVGGILGEPGPALAAQSGQDPETVRQLVSEG
jgi:hypothetical protein